MTGSLALRLDGARELVSQSASFRERRNAADAAAAIAGIHFDEVIAANLQPEVTLASRRPFCLIGVDRHGYIQIGQGLQVHLGGTGGIFCLFSDNPRTPDDHSASYLEFCDWFSSVMDEVAANSGKNTYWPFNSIELAIEPYRAPFTQRESDDFWVAAYVLGDSINSGGGGL